MTVYGMNMDADDFYKRLNQNENLKKQVSSSMKKNCIDLKSSTSNSTDFTSSKEIIAETYLALISSFEGRAKDAIIQRFNESATILMNTTDSREEFLNSIKIK
ncbi:hypothetical protein [Bacillus atrophaeus]|uniref:hypothetical protein n=1 Tax=Bacillus atrophaeus TaxID=1452 RepID=UPI002E21E334|nr:hypothetical protein [Bacillus atrophaeus]